MRTLLTPIFNLVLVVALATSPLGSWAASRDRVRDSLDQLASRQPLHELRPGTLEWTLAEYKTFFVGLLKLNENELIKSANCFGQHGAPHADCKDIRKKAHEQILPAFREMRQYLALIEPADIKASRDPNVNDYSEAAKDIAAKLNPTPQHPFQEYNLEMSIGDLPAVPEVQELSQSEIDQASSLYYGETQNLTKEFYKDVSREQRLNKSLYEKPYYATANQALRSVLNDRAQASLVRAEQEYRSQNRASMRREFETKYKEKISSYPIIAFLYLKPASPARDQNGRPVYLTKDEDFDEAFASAYQKLASINSRLAAEALPIGLDKADASRDRDKFLTLLRFKSAVDQFQKLPYITDFHRSAMAELITENDKRDLIANLKTIGVYVGAGLLCSFIANKIPIRFSRFSLFATILCSVGVSGLGSNIVMYGQADELYRVRFIEFFSAPGGDGVLQDISQLEEQDAALVWEFVFTFIGAGFGEVGQKYKVIVNRVKKLSPSTKRYFLEMIKGTL